MMTHVVGIDPGLVHTGVVRMVFNPVAKAIRVDHCAVTGPNVGLAKTWILKEYQLPMPEVFVEGYRPRQHYGTDSRMTEAVRDFRQGITGAKVLDNTGVKKVVRRSLMELIGVWNYSTPTNHQDLRSAARIALLGMLKDEQHNKLLADVVRAHLDGHPWVVR